MRTRRVFAQTVTYWNYKNAIKRYNFCRRLYRVNPPLAAYDISIVSFNEHQRGNGKTETNIVSLTNGITIIWNFSVRTCTHCSLYTPQNVGLK